MKLLILMGGNSSVDSSTNYPLYMTELNGKMILEIVLDMYCHCCEITKTIFCIRQCDINDYNLDSIIKNLVPNSIIVNIVGETKGAVCTALLASEFVDGEEDVLIVSIDDYITADIDSIIKNYKNNDVDCGIVCFSSVHPRYSFAKIDSNNEICEITEKRPVSKNALASFYYFKYGTDFVESLKNVIRKDNRINDRFYISQAINEMILKQKKILMIKIDNSDFHSIKNEQQLEYYVANYNANKQEV